VLELHLPASGKRSGSAGGAIAPAGAGLAPLWAGGGGSS